VTIAPATLSQMIASTRFEELRKAIVSSLGALMTGVKVVEHPGKLDINDVVAKQIVSAPGVAVGWNRMRAPRDLGGTFCLPVDFVAFIVVEDFADTSAQPPRRVSRDVVANAIGSRLLLILSDPDTGSWGLTGITPPATEPEPDLRPVFTMKTAEQATALFAVTWTQGLILQGASLFDRGPTPGVSADPAEGPPEGLIFDVDLDDELPTEIRALISREEVP
jgi:hypothetical protein